MRFHIITLFPDMFDSYLGESILKRAQQDGYIEVYRYNPRDYTDDPHRRVDDEPYGGGPGMVMMAEPILRVVDDIRLRYPDTDPRIILLSPGGEDFTTDYAKLAAMLGRDIILICGRYEGVDHRIVDALGAELLSIGDYVITGGELAAMVVMDCMSRQIPGVLGNGDSLEESRSSSHAVYTRPESITYKGETYTVPEVLLSGDHKKIDEWRNEH